MNEPDWSITRNQIFLRQLRIRNGADREDAIQNAFIKLRGRPVTLQLLRKTTVNSYRDRVKADGRRRRRELESAGFPSPFHNGSDAESTARQHPIPQESKPLSYSHDPTLKMEQGETRGAIKRAVRAARLSRDHRCALWAWMRERVAEFARRRGVKEVTVRVWAKRARGALRPHLEREGIGPD